ncbi:FkbM family methyltransferase [Lacibacterium aquatile]|uniref:FkbM family methyltransferase n=1 Tax=Lacibacterium aquatile TaxID=1168082 RepID=A0ABW5DU84_9PROT
MADLVDDADGSPELLRACRHYVQRIENDNDPCSETNGEYRFLTDILPFCRTVFDVGACAGNWADKALEINPAAVLHCFEPIPAAQMALFGKVGGRAIINAFALGRENGEAAFFSSAADFEISSRFKRPSFASADLRQDILPVVSLSHYCRQHGVDHIDLLKIDVEGAEVDVLEGGIDLFRQGRIMAAQFEYGGTWLDSRRQLRDVFYLMAGTDYVLAKLMPSGYRVIPDYNASLENFCYSNWLLLQRELADAGAL